MHYQTQWMYSTAPLEDWKKDLFIGLELKWNKPISCYSLKTKPITLFTDMMDLLEIGKQHGIAQGFSYAVDNTFEYALRYFQQYQFSVQSLIVQEKNGTYTYIYFFF